MRGSTFAGETAGNHARAALQGNHVAKHQRPPEDPNGIEYLPEASLPSSTGVNLGGGTGGGGRPPYIKYNSFANY